MDVILLAAFGGIALVLQNEQWEEEKRFAAAIRHLPAGEQFALWMVRLERE